MQRTLRSRALCGLTDTCPASMRPRHRPHRMSVCLVGVLSLLASLLLAPPGAAQNARGAPVGSVVPVQLDGASNLIGQEIRGLATVWDSGTIELQGGRVVGLVGLDKLPLDAAGNLGITAVQTLANLVGNSLVTCRIHGQRPDEILAGQCSTPQVRDLGQALITSGLAYANPSEFVTNDMGNRYPQAQTQAQQSRQGLFALPADRRPAPNFPFAGPVLSTLTTPPAATPAPTTVGPRRTPVRVTPPASLPRKPVAPTPVPSPTQVAEATPEPSPTPPTPLPPRRPAPSPTPTPEPSPTQVAEGPPATPTAVPSVPEAVPSPPAMPSPVPTVEDLPPLSDLQLEPLAGLDLPPLAPDDPSITALDPLELPSPASPVAAAPSLEPLADPSPTASSTASPATAPTGQPSQPPSVAPTASPTEEAVVALGPLVVTSPSPIPSPPSRPSTTTDAPVGRDLVPDLGLSPTAAISLSEPRSPPPLAPPRVASDTSVSWYLRRYEIDPTIMSILEAVILAQPIVLAVLLLLTGRRIARSLNEETRRSLAYQEERYQQERIKQMIGFLTALQAESNTLIGELGQRADIARLAAHEMPSDVSSVVNALRVPVPKVFDNWQEIGLLGYRMATSIRSFAASVHKVDLGLSSIAFSPQRDLANEFSAVADRLDHLAVEAKRLRDQVQDLLGRQLQGGGQAAEAI